MAYKSSRMWFQKLGIQRRLNSLATPEPELVGHPLHAHGTCIKAAAVGARLVAARR